MCDVIVACAYLVWGLFILLPIHLVFQKVIPSLHRYIRREKQISDTKMEMAQSQRIRLQESCDHLQRKLAETEKMLAEERERNTMNMKSAEEHTAILAKVGKMKMALFRNFQICLT